MKPLEAYLSALRDIRSSGEAVTETSYYPALSNLFNEVGKSLKPKVQCIFTIKNRGAGIPDGGLFSEDQYKNHPGHKPQPGQIPSRGVIEVKGTSDDAWVTSESEQVSRYWRRYSQVLVTNYRDFVFVGRATDGNPIKLESYRLARSEKEFWSACAHPRKAADEHNLLFDEFLRRTMRHAAPLSAPEDLAWFLASYARTALSRIGSHDLPSLASVRKALEEALGLQFQGEKGEHFFHSTLVQTLFYGVFSAWVLWSKQNPQRVTADTKTKDVILSEAKNLSSSSPLFDWRLTAHYLRVPILQKLFYEVANPNQLEKLNLSEILDWTSAHPQPHRPPLIL